MSDTSLELGEIVNVEVRDPAGVVSSFTHDYPVDPSRLILIPSLNTIFAEADIVLTPMFTRRPPRVREYDGRGGAYTLAGMVRFAPYAGAFNHTGQPALAVPAGFAGDGFPVGAQLVGPPDSEPLLLAAGAQLQGVRDWHTQIPAVAL